MKITIEQAQILAEKEGFTLFAIGDKVVTNHGYEGMILDIQPYGDDILWCGWSTYTVGFEHGVNLYDFVDVHFTSGGCLKKVIE